ncbi:MAG: hypothetical protein HY221_02735, partial [Candidatus Sungbacteria bacterium]|nr:hypothetical protein [Candidatus Sungbacteria bacterium]
ASVAEQSGPISYTKKLDVTDIDSYTKQATSTVSWQSGGRTLSIVLSTLLTNPTAGSICSPTLSGDWTSPKVYAFPSQFLLPENNSNGLGISDIKVYRQKMYVAAYSAANTNNTLYIFNLPNNPGQQPTFFGETDTASPGLAAVTVFGKYAYVANQSRTAQLQVIDTSNLGAQPTSFKLNNVTGTGGQALGHAIFYANGKIYLGLTTTKTGPEFNIIDVGGGGTLGASPTNPLPLGSYAVGHDVNAIYVSGNYAYIAHPMSSSDTYPEQVTVLDVSNPLTPFRPLTGQGFYKAPDNQGNGKSLAMLGSTLYLGRTVTTSVNPEFYLLNDVDPTNLATNNTSPLGKKISNSVNDLAVRDYLAFLLTNSQFQIWKISDPTNITPWAMLNLSDYTNGNGSGAGTSASCTGNYFYVALASSQGNNKDIIYIIGPKQVDVYALSSSGDIAVTQGSAGSTVITSSIVSGFPQGETLTIKPPGLPTGATATFSNNTCMPTCSDTLTIATTLSTPVGTYPITVVSPSGVSTLPFNLVVNLQPFNYTLSTPVNVTAVRAGSSQNTSFTATLASGNTQSVSFFTNSVLPSGVTMTYSPISASCSPSPTCTVTLTLSASAGAALGMSQITMTGSSPSHTTSFTLTVNPPPFDYSFVTPADVSVNRGSSVTNNVTINIISGAVPQAVTMTSTVSPGVTVNPASASCTPSPSTCTVTFTYTAAAGASTGNKTITINGALPAQSTTFKLKVN